MTSGRVMVGCVHLEESVEKDTSIPRERAFAITQVDRGEFQKVTGQIKATLAAASIIAGLPVFLVDPFWFEAVGW